ncbi:helix-turn-helix domain-containing protein [Bradyrhizobium sp. STM 3561]|uniref:LexA family protein n=1 Tax=Bradyrhizobium sp. STM 3561 TaxID=578923 RepID=UPI00388FC2FB
MFGRPPAEADMQRHFDLSPPSVHQMIVTLERKGLIRRSGDTRRSVESSCPRKLADPNLTRYRTA